MLHLGVRSNSHGMSPLLRTASLLVVIQENIDPRDVDMIQLGPPGVVRLDRVSEGRKP